MAATSIADMIVPEIWQDYAQVNMPYHGTIFPSGIVEVNTNPQFLKSGEYTQEPLLNPLTSTGDAVNIAPDTDVALANFSAYDEYGVVVRRAKGWTQEDLAVIASGVDPMKNGMAQFTEYWNRQLELDIRALLHGVFDTALASTHENDQTASSITTEMVNDTKLLLGEAFDKVNKMFVHSQIYAALTKNGYVDYVDAADYGAGILKTGKIGVFLGMAIFVNDTLCASRGSGAYDTYIMGGQPVRISYQQPLKIETDRNIVKAAGTDFAVSSVHFAPHVKGVSYSSSGTPTSTKRPTRAELATGASWEKVAPSDDLITCLRLVCKP